MRVALVHDYIKEYGGAERVLEALHEIWPDATVFTTLFLPRFLGPHKKRFRNWKIETSTLAKIPFSEKLISPVRVFTPYVFENMDFSGFDLVIVSATGAYFPNLINRKPDTLHVCFCHTPPRYLYGYPTARNWRKTFLGRIMGGFINHHLRQVDFISAQRPDFFLANSKEVQRRIKKFYRREAEVIYPPVGLVDVISKKKLNANPLDAGRYYLTGGRLARAKHIDLAIEACNKLNLPLKVFGRGFAGYEKELEKTAGTKTEFVGEVSEEKLIGLYRDAKALIYPSEDEDFGIIPVEAQAFGVPVVAYRSGGVTESVIDGETGIFFDELTADGIVKSIKLLNQKLIKSENCVKNARRFSKKRFKREILHFVKSKLQNPNDK